MPPSPISLGARGDAVEQLHEVLRQNGAKLPASEVRHGKFGAATRKAVEEFQRRHGLQVSGIVDERTALALQAGTTQFPSPVPERPENAAPSGVTTGTNEPLPLPPITAAPDEPRGIVHGKLVDQDGAPIVGAKIVLISKQLRAEPALAQGATGETGQYTIEYRRSAALNLVVQVKDAKGAAIATSATIFAAPAQLEINLTTAADGVVRSPSRFTMLSASVTAALAGTPLQDLKENKVTHELSFLAKELGSQLRGRRILSSSPMCWVRQTNCATKRCSACSPRARLFRSPRRSETCRCGIDDAFTAQVMNGVLAQPRASLDKR